MKKKIIRFSAVAGILIFGFIIYKIGPKEIWKNITSISLANFIILFALRVLYWLLRTINWKVVLDAYDGQSSLLHLFIARMGGHAVSQLTPTAQVGSEATRIYMANCSSKKVCVASVVVDKTVESLAAVLFTIAGVAAILLRIPLPMKLKTAFIGGVTLASLLVLFVIYKQNKGILGWMMKLFDKLKFKFKFLDKHRDKILETDEHISRFYRLHRHSFLKTFLLYNLLNLLWVAEIHLGIIFIGVPGVNIVDSFIITALGNLAFVYPIVPGSIGVYEATYIGLFALMGMGAGPALTLVLIRRLIALLLAGLGLLGMLKPAEA